MGEHRMNWNGALKQILVILAIIVLLICLKDIATSKPKIHSVQTEEEALGIKVNINSILAENTDVKKDDGVVVSKDKYIADTLGDVLDYVVKQPNVTVEEVDLLVADLLNLPGQGGRANYRVIKYISNNEVKTELVPLNNVLDKNKKPLLWYDTIGDNSKAKIVKVNGLIKLDDKYDGIINNRLCGVAFVVLE